MSGVSQFVLATCLGRVLPESRCIFGPADAERAYVPDLVSIARERLPQDIRAARYLCTAPDLAVEILSPGQPAGRFADKVQFYLHHGVRLVWAVDPQAQEVIVFVPERDPVTRTDEDALAGGDVLPGFRVAVAEVFAQLHVEALALAHLRGWVVGRTWERQRRARCDKPRFALTPFAALDGVFWCPCTLPRDGGGQGRE